MTKKIFTTKEIEELGAGTLTSTSHIDFTAEEIQEYLITLGYLITKFSGPIKQRRYGEKNAYEGFITTILAVKPSDLEKIDGDDVRADDPFVLNSRIDIVFRNELKKVLLRPRSVWNNVLTNE